MIQDIKKSKEYLREANKLKAKSPFLNDVSIYYNAFSFLEKGDADGYEKTLVEANNKLTVTGNIVNNGGNGGLTLISNSMGSASLIHNSADVAGTVERYIGGLAEDWHFLSSPVIGQAISGTWLPSGTYGNGTGYGNVITFKTNATAAIITTNVTTIAGSTTSGKVDGPGTSALFDGPEALAFNPATGNIYIGDTFNNSIRTMTTTGTVASLTNGTLGFANGPVGSALFYGPKGFVSGPYSVLLFPFNTLLQR